MENGQLYERNSTRQGVACRVHFGPHKKLSLFEGAGKRPFSRRILLANDAFPNSEMALSWTCFHLNNFQTSSSSTCHLFLVFTLHPFLIVDSIRSFSDFQIACDSHTTGSQMLNDAPD
jgi:hypothetical protein